MSDASQLNELFQFVESIEAEEGGAECQPDIGAACAFLSSLLSRPVRP